MSLKGMVRFALPIVVAVTGWFVAPIIKAKMDGTPLNGLPGILAYWKGVVTTPMPIWLLFGAVIVAVAVTIFLKSRRKPKPNLSVIILPAPPPRWSVGKDNLGSFLTVHFHARFATTEEHPLEIVKGYLEGTEPVILFSRIIVAGRYDQSMHVHLAVRPILVQPGENLTRRLLLIDQHGNMHRTEKITFLDHPSPKEVFGFGHGTPVNCLICGQQLSMEDLHPSAAFAAHKRCVR
jgi:hypothetical protein